jgi:glycosyltransferase involved in cell wall biosynthesis
VNLIDEAARSRAGDDGHSWGGHRVRVLHVITDLNVGGAEIMLLRLLQGSDSSVIQEVVSLSDLGVTAELIRKLGIKTHTLGMDRRWPSPSKLLRLASLMRRFRPDVVQTWMYHADLFGGLAARLAGGTKVVWGIHNSTLHPRTTRWRTRWIVAFCARISGLVPDAIISVSGASRDLHVAAGYRAEKFVVISNGFDLAQYRLDPALRDEVRAELGLDEATPLIGLVARVDPQKDHGNFIRAASLLAARQPGVRFLLCGEGATPANAGLVDAIREQGLLDRFLLLGRRDDVPRIMRALDVGSLSSAYGEAFPLVIGEAMASGVPCVVTDLGDCAYLVGDTGRVVAVKDPAALANAWEGLLLLGADGRRRLGLAARARVETHFSLPRIVGEYLEVYRRVLGEGAASGLTGTQPG